MPREATKRPKAGWTTVAFGDVVRQVKDKVDPEDSGLERYVAGEHMDTDDLRIRRWGEIGDGYLGPAFHMRFKPGQVLYGSRRTYLRKVAVADFEGITANTTYVLESANSKVLLPELLPFIMQAEAFHQHSVRESKGSVNPYVNFSDLAWFDFALPPLEEQRRIVMLLRAGLALHDRLYDLELRGSAAKDALIETRLRGLHLGGVTLNARVGRYHTGWPLVALKDLLELSQYGLSAVAGARGQYPMLRMMNLEEGYAVENDIVFIDLEDREFERYRLRRGDVLFNRTNSYDLVGRTGVYELNGDHVFASYLVRLRVDPERLDPTYLCSFLNAPLGRRQVMSCATRGVSQTNVNASNLGRVLVPLPPLEYQQRTVSAARAIRSAEASVGPRIAGVRGMLARVIRDGVTL